MKNKYSSLRIFFVSLVMISIIILPVMITNGGNLYLVGDYMSQQIPFIKEARRLFLSGKPFWSCNTFLGSNFLGTYSFYNYASPFYLPLFIIPEKFIGIGLSITFILKHSVAAVTSHLYLKKHTSCEHLAFIGALIYSFSCFTMDSTYYFHFIDVIAVFPFIPYLVDEVLDGKKKYLLSLAVLLNAAVNYYFLFSTSVFLLIYLFFKVRFSDGKYNFKDAARCIVFYAAGGLAAMFILLPSALSLLETDKATSSFASSFLRGLCTIPQLLKILKAIVLPSEGVLGSSTGFIFSNFNSNAAFLPFFGAVFLFIALKKQSDKWYYKLIRFLFILTVIPFGNGIFSLFTNMSYTRWYYAFVLMSILASIKILEEKPQKSEIRKSFKTIGLISAAVLGIPLVLKIFCAYCFPQAIEILPDSTASYLTNAGLTEAFTSNDLRYCAVFLTMTAVSYIPLFFSLKKEWIYKAKKAVPAAVLICIISYTCYISNEANVFDTQKNINYKGADISSSDEASYSSRTQFNNSFANYPAVVNEPGIGAFISFKSHSSAKFCNLVGFENTLHLSSEKHFDTPAIQSLLSVKYLVDGNGKRTSAPYYTPFGFTYDYYILDEGYKYTADREENNRRIELMTAACFIDKETAEKLDGIVTPFDGEKKFDWKKEYPKTGAENFEMTSEGFTAVSNVRKTQLMFFSIPHDNGWKAYVNGKETEIFTVNGGLMGVIVPAGKSEIKFEFHTPGLALGSAISAATLLALAVSFLFERKKRQIK